MKLIIYFILTVAIFITVSMAVPILQPISIATLPIVILPNIANNNGQQEYNTPTIDYQTALQLYTMAEETSQSIEGIYVAHFSGLNPEYFYQYCYYNPILNNIEGCNTESILKDLKLLNKMTSLYDTVINYEEITGQTGYIALEQMKHTKTKLNDLISYIKQTFEIEGSGNNNEGNLYYTNINTNTASTQCDGCNSLSDEYSIIMEMKVAIELTVNHLKCIKESLNPEQ